MTDREYTDQVTPGGPADVRERAHLTITKVTVGSHDNNAFVLRSRETGEQLLIGAPTEAARVLEVIGDAGWRRSGPRMATTTTGRRCARWWTRRAPARWPSR